MKRKSKVYVIANEPANHPHVAADNGGSGASVRDRQQRAAVQAFLDLLARLIARAHLARSAEQHSGTLHPTNPPRKTNLKKNGKRSERKAP